MLPILTPQESVALDRASSERGVSVATLMENAGRAVARAAATACGGTYGRRAVVVCGKGNNGGDGLVAARYLDRWGMAVTTILLAPSDAFTGAAAASVRRLVETGSRCLPFSGSGLDRELARADVVVDAVFGTGFRGVAEGSLAAAIAAINQGLAAVVAVDIPSGVDGETGSVAGIAVQADTTVALGALKPGVVFFPGAAHAGEVQVADIGFSRDLVRTDLWLAERSDVACLLRPRGPETHKREVGTVLVVAGSRTMTGAAILAASAAYRAGGGLVTLAVPEGILPIVQSAITEATFLPLPETPEGTISEEAWPLLEERLALAGSAAAAAVGPGLTTHPSTAELVRRLVVASSVPLVLDADGLGAFAGRGALICEHRSELVMTPHAGEFGRLAGLSSEEVTKDRVGHARKAAAEFRSTVLLKGSRTVIAEPAGRAMVNPTGGPYLATGGTGDVLTGAIAAFLARGLAPSDAALLGAYANGLAGKAAHAEVGEGTVASDVSARLPRVLAELARDRPSFAGEA